jgi:hypothetical protein
MCYLDLLGINQIIVLCTSSDTGNHLCQIIFFKSQRFKSPGADRKCRILSLKWRLFNIWPLRVTLTLKVATQLLSSAHPLVMVITCAKLFKKNEAVLKLWSGHESVTDGQIDGRTDWKTDWQTETIPMRKAINKIVEIYMKNTWSLL